MAGMGVCWTEEKVAWLKEHALECGFSLAGVAAAEGATEPELQDAARFTAWVDSGRAGEMEYLKRRDAEGRLLRTGVHVAIPWARSVVICSLNYRTPGPLSREAAPAGAGWIGRYAWSGAADAGRETARSGELKDRASAAPELRATDYHDVLLRRLQALERMIRAEFHQLADLETRSYVDTGPLVERSAAVRAGLGWTGKNTTLIHQGLGSWTLLATIVTSIPLEQAANATWNADRCGSCTRCLEACPTQALVAPREMDASRCIAYLTIEKKGTIDADLREGMGRQIFGCDICQEVCPWNRRGPVVQDAEMLPRGELINPDLEWLAGLTPAEFRRWFRGSPLERTGQKRLRRNLAIAMGNSGEARFLSRLEQWACGADPVLAEAAQWALGRLRGTAAEQKDLSASIIS